MTESVDKRKNLKMALFVLAVFLAPAVCANGDEYEIQQYTKASKDFYAKEQYYNDIVNNAPVQKNGKSKFLIVSDTGDVSEPNLLVYDESDDLSNKQSRHIPLFVAMNNHSAPGIALSPDTVIVLVHVFAKKIKSHFYFAILEYGAPLYEVRTINGREIKVPIQINLSGQIVP